MKLHLERLSNEKYEVQNDRYNWIGDLKKIRTKMWIFEQARDRHSTLSELKEIVKLMQGLRCKT